jgi:hypothetical protein
MKVRKPVNRDLTGTRTVVRATTERVGQWKEKEKVVWKFLRNKR